MYTDWWVVIVVSVSYQLYISICWKVDTSTHFFVSSKSRLWSAMWAIKSVRAKKWYLKLVKTWDGVSEKYMKNRDRSPLFFKS